MESKTLSMQYAERANLHLQPYNPQAFPALMAIGEAAILLSHIPSSDYDRTSTQSQVVRLTPLRGLANVYVPDHRNRVSVTLEFDEAQDIRLLSMIAPRFGIGHFKDHYAVHDPRNQRWTEDLASPAWRRASRNIGKALGRDYISQRML